MFLRQFIHAGEECLTNLHHIRRIVRTKEVITIEYVPTRGAFFPYTPPSVFRWENEEEAVRAFDQYATQIRYGVHMSVANKLR